MYFFAPLFFPCFQAFATSGCEDVQSVLWHATAAAVIVRPADNRREPFIMETGEYLLQVKNITKAYAAPGGTRAVLKDISFQVPEGGLFCIMGSSGSGKSTLLKILGGMELPTSGEILYNNRRMADFTPDDYDVYRQKEVGFIFQDFNLLDGLTLKENIILPLTFLRADGETIEKRYQEVIRWAGLSSCENNYPEKASGGEQQRAAICRALIKKPRLLLADEPTGSLDSRNGEAVLDTLLRAKHTFGTTIILVTHDAFAASCCDTVVFLEDGRIGRTLQKTGSRQHFYKVVASAFSEVRGLL